jgi:hypothetical protein
LNRHFSSGLPQGWGKAEGQPTLSYRLSVAPSSPNNHGERRK